MSHWREGPCYYASVRDGQRHGALAGPYRTHREALAVVDACTAWAHLHDPWAWFYAFGTCLLKTGAKEGSLNARIGYTPDPLPIHDKEPHHE